MMPNERSGAERKAQMPQSWPALMSLEQALDVARATMVCETCRWAEYVDPCAEKTYVRGCVHWKRGGK